MSQQEITGGLSPEETEAYLNRLRLGRDDIVYFAENVLGLPLHDGQKRYLDNAKKQKNVLACGNKWGKGLWVKEKVLTPNGYVNAEEVKLGDTLFSEDGSFTKVAGVYPQGKQQTYKFIFNDGATAIVDGSHLWKFKNRSGRFRDADWIVNSTDSIIKDYGYKQKSNAKQLMFPGVEPLKFEKRKVEIDPYIMGLLLGDGCFRGSSITFSTADNELVDKFKKLGYKIIKAKNDKNDYNYRVNGIKGIIKKYGLVGCDSKSKFIPDDYLYNDIESRLQLLRGLLDSDGSISSNGHGVYAIEYSTISDSLKEGVKFLVQSLGGQVRINKRVTWFTYKGIKKNGKPSYRVNVRIDVCPFLLIRKANRFSKYKRTSNRILKEIVKLDERETVCFKVDHQSRMFVINDCILTHNSFVISILHIYNNYYKIGVKVNSTADWKKAEYRTLGLSPHSKQISRTYQYICDILNSKIVFPDANGEMVTNKCIIPDFIYKASESQGVYIKFSNGAFFEAVPTGQDHGDSIQSIDYDLATYDEAGRSNDLERELDANIMPRLIARGGILHLLSTPDKDSPSLQYYYHLVQEGMMKESSVYVQTGGLRENTFLSKENIDAVLESIDDPEVRDQIEFGKFIFIGGVRFTGQAIEGMWLHDLDWEDDREGSLPGMCMPGHPIAGHHYVGGLDWANSSGGDYTVLTIIDVSAIPYQIVYIMRVQTSNHYEKYSKIREVYNKFNNCEIVADTNGPGNLLTQDLEDIGLISFTYTSRNQFKNDILGELQKALNHDVGDIKGKLRSIYYKPLADELSVYKDDDKKLRTDCVMALSLAIWHIDYNGLTQTSPSDKYY